MIFRVAEAWLKQTDSVGTDISRCKIEQQRLVGVQESGVAGVQDENACSYR
jgi:hypothetical protein